MIVDTYVASTSSRATRKVQLNCYTACKAARALLFSPILLLCLPSFLLLPPTLLLGPPGACSFKSNCLVHNLSLSCPLAQNSILWPRNDTLLADFIGPVDAVVILIDPSIAISPGFVATSSIVSSQIDSIGDSMRWQQLCFLRSWPFQKLLNLAPILQWCCAGLRQPARGQCC
jgi:hypothetical protein